MKTSLEFVSKPGCEEQINKAYAQLTGIKDDWLVYSERVIMEEIAFMNSGEGRNHRAHLRDTLKTVADWDICFPDHAHGTGYVPLVANRQFDGARIKRDIEFVYQNQLLFQSIDGLENALALWHPNKGLPRKARGTRKAA